MQRLEEIKSDPSVDKTNLISGADKLCYTLPVVVTSKTTCITDNPHNYESLSSYYWPDPNNPLGPYIELDGQLNPEVKEYDRTKIDELSSNLKCLSIAYYMTDNKKYYYAFLRHLRAWFLDKKTFMEPHFEYAQVIKGKDNNHGQPHGLIDAYALTDVLDAIRLVDHVKPLRRSDIKKLKKWTTLFAEWMVTSTLGVRESRQLNNHGPAYDALLFDLAIFSDNMVIADAISSSYKKERIDKLILSDGSQSYELKRTRAYHYSALSLSFMIDFCIMQGKYNYDYKEFLPDIRKACDYLEKFIGHRDSFPYSEISDWDYNENMVRENIARINELSGELLKTREYNFYTNYNKWIK